MKRLFSLMMALVMVLSLGITVFAEDPETPAAPAPGTITVTNATVDKVQTVFKIFDATHSGTSVSYSIASDSQFYNVLFIFIGQIDNIFIFIHDCFKFTF